MRRYKRILAAVLIAAVLSALLFSAAFIVSRSGHDCRGHRCTVCVCIGICKATLNILSLVPAAYSLYRGVLCGCVIFTSRIHYGYFSHTLVNLKVKLSD